LVGTELAFNYLKNSVPLAIIASLDSLFTIPNFKITEKILEIILSTGNLASDKFIIETKNPDNEIINAFKNANLLPYIKGELKERRELEYPPYKRFVKISFWGEKDEVEKTKKYLEREFKKYDPIIYGGFTGKTRRAFNMNALLKLDTKDWSYTDGKMEEDLAQKLSVLPQGEPSRPMFNIQIDPEDLL